MWLAEKKMASTDNRHSQVAKLDIGPRIKLCGKASLFGVKCQPIAHLGKPHDRNLAENPKDFSNP